MLCGVVNALTLQPDILSLVGHVKPTTIDCVVG